MSWRNNVSRLFADATPRLGIHYDPEAFGEFSEAIARNLGTARFLVIQTVVVAIWILINVALITLRWDPYPFILLNLAFSTQAAYAAPLILLAQNRQEDRDRGDGERDRARSARLQADTCAIAAVDGPQERDFGAAFDKSVRQPQVVTTVEGVNYSNGLPVAITLYRMPTE
jgi:hypothetical protein